MSNPPDWLVHEVEADGVSARLSLDLRSLDADVAAVAGPEFEAIVARLRAIPDDLEGQMLARFLGRALAGCCDPDVLRLARRDR